MGYPKESPKRNSFGFILNRNSSKSPRSSVTLWAFRNFKGQPKTFINNIAISNVHFFQFKFVVIPPIFPIYSLKLNGDDDTTLILFSGTNYQGKRVILRGQQDIPDLGAFETGSFILSNRVITSKQADQIQARRRPPSDFSELVLGIVRRRLKKKNV